MAVRTKRDRSGIEAEVFERQASICKAFANATRLNVYEAYLTHRIHDHFLLKGSYINYDYAWSGSGWQVGAPKLLTSSPILGFPTYVTAKMVTAGIVAEF